MKVTVQIENPELQGKVKFKIQNSYVPSAQFIRKESIWKKRTISYFYNVPHNIFKCIIWIFNLQMLKLQAAIKYGEEDLAGAKSLVDQCPNDDPDTDINRGMWMYLVINIIHCLINWFIISQK